MNKITKSLLTKFSQEFELQRLSESVQFEHFANFSITSKLFRGSFELEDIHTGGGNDLGLDGVLLLVNGRIITELEQLNDIAEYSNYLDVDLCFVQAKTSSAFSGSDIGTFIRGVKYFLDEESDAPQNDDVRKMREIWENLIEDKAHLMVNRNPSCKMYYVTTGRWVEDQHLNAILKSGKCELEQLDLFDTVKIIPLGNREIQSYYNDSKSKLQNTVKFSNRITLPDIDGVSEGYLGLINFKEYLALIQDESQSIYSIFEDNVRDFQGMNDVNQKIKKTLEDKKYDLFCVLNNGVTVVADTITAAGDRFTLRDYQVVNGCQTSHVLHECQSLEGVEQVEVPIKIVVTESEDVKTAIVLATNSQTEVKTEQLAALASFQRELEMYYEAEQPTFALYYERRSQQFNGAGINRTKVVTIPNQIKAFASIFLKSPHLVSGYYGTIVNRFEGRIFDKGHVHIPYFVSSMCLYRIEQFFRSGEIDPSYKKVRYHLMLLVALLIEPEIHSYPLNSNKLEKACEKLKMALLDDSDSLSLFKHAVLIYEESPLDKSKRQYKAESDTEILLEFFQKRS